MPAGFNAEQRAKERESGPVVLGEVTYHPRRLTNQRLREVRKFSRASQLAAKTAGKESEDYQEAYQAALDAGLLDEEALKRAQEAGDGSDEVAEVNQQALIDQLPLLLVDDNMQPPTAEAIREHLENDLDARDVGGLMDYLLGAPKEDPTPTTGQAATTP
jgi:hypothetical protein